jgi:hypothetical protein
MMLHQHCKGLLKYWVKKYIRVAIAESNGYATAIIIHM